MLSWRSGPSPFTRAYDTRPMQQFSVRLLVIATTVLTVALALGTIGFQHTLGEGWMDACYRSMVTVTLTGIDTRRSGTAAELLTIGLMLVGVAIFAYIASTLVELIARGVLTGAWAERRRRRAIERLRDHYIICGYGRVGQQIGSEFRVAGAQYVVVDFHENALAAARERNDYFIEGDGTDEDDLEAAGLSR